METLNPWNPEANLPEAYQVVCSVHGLIAQGVSLVTAFNAKTDHYKSYKCNPTDIDIWESIPVWADTMHIDEKLYKNQHDTG